MTDVLSSDIERLETAFAGIERDAPFLKPVVDAFKGLMINQAILKARLAERTDIPVSPPDNDLFSTGQPWLTKEMVALLIDPWGETVRFTMLYLLTAFPGIAMAVQKLREILEGGELELESCMLAFVKGREEDIIKAASIVPVDPAVLKFILGQILKPFVEKRTENLRAVIKDLPWHRGYCPICGSFPELSFVQGDEGQRWLRCCLCGYDWRYDRMACPGCGERNPSKEFLNVVGFEHEWVELCPDCQRYSVGTDLRKQAGLIPEVAAIGMVHLDIIAQRKGFFPTAICAWNMVTLDE